MGKHRSRLKILSSILSVVSANDGAKKTQIMYQAYLSYKLLVQYLSDLTEAGLVNFGRENCYRLTSKGKAFLNKYDDYDQSRVGVSIQLNHVESMKMTLHEMCPNTEITNGKHNNKINIESKID